MVVDSTQLPPDDRLVPDFLQGHLRSVLPSREPPKAGAGADPERCLLVLNKSDLVPLDRRERVEEELRRSPGLPPVCFLSCHTSSGLEAFLSLLHSHVKTL